MSSGPFSHDTAQILILTYIHSAIHIDYEL